MLYNTTGIKLIATLWTGTSLVLILNCSVYQSTCHKSSLWGIQLVPPSLVFGYSVLFIIN